MLVTRLDRHDTEKYGWYVKSRHGIVHYELNSFNANFNLIDFIGLHQVGHQTEIADTVVTNIYYCL